MAALHLSLDAKVFLVLSLLVFVVLPAISFGFFKPGIYSCNDYTTSDAIGKCVFSQIVGVLLLLPLIIPFFVFVPFLLNRPDGLLAPFFPYDILPNGAYIYVHAFLAFLFVLLEITFVTLVVSAFVRAVKNPKR